MPVKWSFKILMGGDGRVLFLGPNTYPQKKIKYWVMNLSFEYFVLDNCKFFKLQGKTTLSSERKLKDVNKKTSNKDSSLKLHNQKVT